MQTFEETGLNKNILRAISDLGFENPTPIQEKTISHLLSTKRDLIGLAQTGTGKTAAFSLPIVEQVNVSSRVPQALILCPTRELCIQVANDVIKFSKYVDGLSPLAIYGGANIELQIKALQKGAQIIAGTPGRVNDLIRRRKLDLSNIKWLVLDEADEMLNMGFKEELDEILKSVPEGKQTLLFSATMPKEISMITKKYMSDPLEISAGKKNAGADTVNHYYYMVSPKHRYLALKRVVDINPNIYGLVFCRTRMETKEVADRLIEDGYNADALHGDLSQAQRDMVMARFRQKSLQILVATDVAARGLDVNSLTHVINFNLPDDIEAYTHRSGRTGRAGKNGVSIAIINSREKGKIREIEKKLGRQFEYKTIPDGREICEKQLFHLVEKLEQTVVNDVDIDDYLPPVMKKLEDLTKEEIIKKLIAVEFNRFHDYYKNTEDINVSDNGDSRSSRGVSNANLAKLFINIGVKDSLNKGKLLELLNDVPGMKEITIGKIEILKTFTFFEVDKNQAQEAVNILNDLEYQGRPWLLKLKLVKKEKNAQEKESVLEILVVETELQEINLKETIATAKHTVAVVVATTKKEKRIN
ncbi:MAG: DEAD/DEAH box helicase [Bacteroidales bacterium]|nr:DEAD/DEAH box helicase [Bacteroidales bacterium]